MKKLFLASVIFVFFLTLPMQSIHSAIQHTLSIDQLMSEKDIINTSLSGGTLQLYARSQ